MQILTKEETAVVIKLLRSMDHKNIKGCIVGKAIYENKINLEEVFS